MVYLLFKAERIKPHSRWTFWRYDRAFIYSWIDKMSVAEGKERAEQDMLGRGWRVTSYKIAKLVSPDEYPKGLLARTSIKQSQISGSSYFFDRDLPALGPGDANAVAQDGVRQLAEEIDPATVPEQFRPLLRLAAEWAIGDDVVRMQHLASRSPQEREAFVRVVLPLMDELESWCASKRDLTPVPDAVIIFDRLMEAVSEAV